MNINEELIDLYKNNIAILSPNDVVSLLNIIVEKYKVPCRMETSDDIIYVDNELKKCIRERGGTFHLKKHVIIGKERDMFTVMKHGIF